MSSFADAVAAASTDRLQELIALLVERVETTNQRISNVIWTPPARPFFSEPTAETDRENALFERPRTDSNPHQQRSVLDWYLEVG